MVDISKSKDGPWSTAVGRLIGSKQAEIREKNRELFQKNIVINNLKRKLCEERDRNKQATKELETECEEQLVLNKRLRRKLREVTLRKKEHREDMDEVRKALDALAGVGLNNYGSIPLNELRWLYSTGKMHLIKYEHRENIWEPPHLHHHTAEQGQA